MNRLESIKSGLECWDNHFPLNPPETKAEEILREEIKRRAQLFHAQGIENVRYLLQRLERYETALKEIRHITPYGMYHEIIDNALGDQEAHRGGLLNPDGGDYPLKWMSEPKE